MPPDDFFPRDVMELLVLHELAHGLLALASEEGVLAEQACNRIARLSKGDFATPLMNEQREAVVGEAWYGHEGESRHSAEKLDKRKWLAVVADALPKDERAVIAALYYEGLSMREAATVLGCDVHTVFRRKASALERLRRYYNGLDVAAFSNARKLVELRMPEGGAEHQIIWEVHHRCPQSNALARELNDNDIDLLVYPVGNVGYNMPVNTVFAVDPLGPCAACGREPRCQFVFRKGHVTHAGSIWTPG